MENEKFTWTNWWNKDTQGVAVGLISIVAVAVIVGFFTHSIELTQKSIIGAGVALGLFVVAYFIFTNGILKILGTLIGAAFIALFLFGVLGCAGYTPSVSAGLGYELHDNVVGRSPTGTFVLKQPLLSSNRICVPYTYVEADFLHISSLPDVHDTATINQAQIMFNLPLGKVAN